MSSLLLMTVVLGSAPAQPEPRDIVFQWNERAVAAIRADRTPPPLAARNLAIVHTAIYDAIQTVHRTHAPYHVRRVAPPGTVAEAAAAVAAHRTLVALYPRQVECFDVLLDESIATLPEGAGRDNGVEIGRQVAEAILDQRRGDRVRHASAYAARSQPGIWLPTPPDFQPPLLPYWGSLRPFVLRSPTQFRPPAPPALDSARYTTAFNEVKSLGQTRSPVRTAEQTEIARFWEGGPGTGTPPGHWNDIARTVARARKTTMVDNARLFALLNLALADAGIACWDCKFDFRYWRPIHAIRAADADGNPQTDADRTWEPLLPTPPFPAYTSAHSTFSAAAATILAAFFGRDDVLFTVGCDSLPNVSRSFPGFQAAADEAGRSRIYGGIHWEFDNTEGLKCGREVGEYIHRHALLPERPKPPW